MREVFCTDYRGGESVGSHRAARCGGVFCTDYCHAARPRDSVSRDRIFSCQPTAPSDEAACARAILSRVGRLAYRRPLEAPELKGLLGFYAQGRRDGDFEAGIELALRYVLASPQFIFRLETEPVALAAGEIYPLGDLDLASRLSFFLWSSIPDDALLTAADRGELSDRDGLSRQVRRMLADPRAAALVENFAGQWLYVRNLGNITPDRPTFPDFDDNLRRAMQRETELFVESIMREDRSVLDLLTADYTYVNERLARHYEIPGVYGDRFRRVPVTDEHRRGLLGHGSVLTVTSYATRTSPVLRGKWILDNLLGAPPPPPPPDVRRGGESVGSHRAARCGGVFCTDYCHTCQGTLSRAPGFFRSGATLAYRVVPKSSTMDRDARVGSRPGIQGAVHRETSIAVGGFGSRHCN